MLRLRKRDEVICQKPQSHSNQDLTRCWRQSPSTMQLAAHWNTHNGNDNKPSAEPPLVTQVVWSSWLPGILFHSNNLQVCGSHTPNFNLSVMGDLLLKCLAINWSGVLVASLTIHYTLTSRVCWVTDNLLSQALLPQMGFPWRVCFHQSTPLNTLNEWMAMSLDGTFTRVSQRYWSVSSLAQGSCSQSTWSQEPFARKGSTVGIYQIRHLNEQLIIFIDSFKKNNPFHFW